MRTSPIRYCPTCNAAMTPAGKRAWVCPNQNDQGNGISYQLLQKVKAMAAERVQGQPF